jgi:hypothetical protein
VKSLGLVRPVDLASYPGRHLGDKPNRFGMNIGSMGQRQLVLGWVYAVDGSGLVTTFVCEIQRRHRLHVLDWLHGQFQYDIEPASLYQLFSA